MVRRSTFPLLKESDRYDLFGRDEKATRQIGYILAYFKVYAGVWDVCATRLVFQIRVYAVRRNDLCDHRGGNGKEGISFMEERFVWLAWRMLVLRLA